MTDITATTEAQIIDAVEGARDWKSPLNIVGARTKRSFGRPVANWGTVLDVSSVKGIVDYKPEELIITAKPGTPVAEINAALAEKNQRLGFDPPDIAPLMATRSGDGTIGGAISCDLAGPAAMRYGRARDHLLGIRAVNGYGEAFKAGGKVVKNVTGFDIPKLFCGAFGTLSVLTEITLRVFPKPPLSAVFEVGGLSSADALALLRRVWASPLEPTGLVYLPAAAARQVPGVPDNACLIRLEGAAAPLAEKCTALRELLDRHDLVENEDGSDVIDALGNAMPFHCDLLSVWQVAIAPSHAAAFIDALNPQMWFADWAGGRLWVGVSESTARIHDMAVAHQGYATQVRHDAEVVPDVPPFPPLSPERLALTRAVKAAFDPLGLFNPGRMYNDV